MKRLLFLFVFVFTLFGCDKFDELPQTPIIPDGDQFHSIKGDINGFDEFVYNDNSFIFYKENDAGLPEAMLVYVNDDEEEVLEAVYFNESGIPEYYNINGKSIYVENIRGKLCDLLIVSEDGTFTTLKDVDADVDINQFWREQQATRASNGSSVVGAVNLSDRILGARYLMQGSVDMALGAYGMLMSCAMLVPGCNVVVGTIVVVGGLVALTQFTSGAMKVARATDLLVSDGTHTDGIYNTTSEALSRTSSICGTFGSVGRGAANLVIDEGVDATLDQWDKRARDAEALEKKRRIGALTLATLDADVDCENCSATLHGSLSSILSSNDYAGIYISDDPSTETVLDCNSTRAHNGSLSFTFDNLERCKTYYYRVYYASEELERTLVGKSKKFVVPGVKTNGYTKVSDNSYNVSVEAILGEPISDAEVGVCYSTEERMPTIEDNITDTSQISSSQTLTFSIYSKELPCYYRAYMILEDGTIVYGDTKTIDEPKSERDILIQFYHDTGGDNWADNDNWCSDKPLEEWYGVQCNNEGRVIDLDLNNNHLSGNGTLSGLTALEKLYCEDNQLTSLDVSGCTALVDLRCNYNQLTSLDVSGCMALVDLWCNYNQLTSLDVSGLTALEYLMCDSNQLTSLDVSGCTALESLSYLGGELTSLDVSGCTALVDLWCQDNQLTSLDVSGCTALENLWCNKNQLTSLDVSGCTALCLLYCHSNQLTSLDVSGCTALCHLYCDRNQLTSLDVSGCTALWQLYCDNNQLTSLDVSGCTALVDLSCYNNQLTSLDVSGCMALEDLDCYNNQLTSLDVSGCMALEDLECDNNQLTSLDVSGCTALEYLDCSDNRITQVIPDYLYGVRFIYDVRYAYWTYNDDQRRYTDNGVGWWYPGEPEKGYHGK